MSDDKKAILSDPHQQPQQQYGTYTNQPGYPTVNNQQPTLAADAVHRKVVVRYAVTQPIQGDVYPSNYCELAWCSCLCGFLPLAICAVFNSKNTSDAIDRGDLAAAITYSKRAKYYAIAAMIIGAVLILTLTLLATLPP